MDQAHLAVRFAQACTDFSGRPATRVRVNDEWRIQTYFEVGRLVRAAAARLVTAGIAPGDRVAIFSTNRPEWTTADFAILSTRAIVVPIYPTSTPEQVCHILNDSGASIAFVEGARELERVLQVWPELHALQRVVTFDPSATADARVVAWSDWLSGEPDADADAEVGERLAQATGNDIATIIYTSGTTGQPRGAMLRHAGFTYQSQVLTDFFDLTPDDHSLCFLPLSHALERAWTFHVLSQGCMNTYTDAHKVAEMLVLARPTLLVSVPRLYEKVLSSARDKVAGSPAKKRIFEWALRVGGKCQHAYRKGRTPSPYWSSQLFLANKLVLGSIRDAIGGPKKVLASGGAPLRLDVEEFFSACGMLLLSGYGMTEASPLISFPSPQAFKFGTAGRVLPGGEIKLGPDSELWYRGPNVMEGYWNLPDATAAALDADGWLHTGDVGYVDTDGFVVITDRIKDLIVTSNGKNIAPAPIEGMLMADPLFEQAVILGDNRPYLTLLVAPSLPHLEDLAKSLQIPFTTAADLLGNPQVVEEVKKRAGALTAKLPTYEQIRDLRILPEGLTLDNGLLTPTLKVRRREVEKRFAELIEGMYNRVTSLRGKGGKSD